VNSIGQYVCPFCLQADALFKVGDDSRSIDGWTCQRCKSIQLRDSGTLTPRHPQLHESKR
jgi:transposase-like protein